MNTTKLQALANSKSEMVEAIEGMMLADEKNDAHRFLMVMNSIVDYYLRKGSENTEICYPIIRIPHAPKWAKEVFAEFLTLKLSLQYNTDTQNVLRGKWGGRQVHNITSNKAAKEYKNYTIPCKKYIKDPILSKSSSIVPLLGNTGHKNMIFVCENIAFCNDFITEFWETNNLSTTKNLIRCDNNVNELNIRNALKKYREEYPETSAIKIDNVFIFYTNNKKIESLNKSALTIWNTAYKVGVRNCFVFDFQEQSFRLDRELKRRECLCRKFSGETLKNYPEFITFDEDETNYLFRLEKTYEHILLKDDPEYFTETLGSFLDDELDYPIRERNLFSLCNKETKKEYENYLKAKCSSFKSEDYEFTFHWQIDTAEEELRAQLIKAISDNRRIAIVIDKSTPNNLKDKLKRYFKNIIAPTQISVNYYDYSALKPKDGKNCIKESCVIVLQYRPHYVGKPYPKFPNSFDPFVTNEGQKIVEFIQGFVFQNMYEWDQYYYNKAKYDLFSSSDYRKATLDTPQKTISPNYPQVTGETDFSDEGNNPNTIQYVVGEYEDGGKIHIPQTDFIIWEDKEKVRKIGRFSTLILAEDNSLSDVVEFQRLDDIAEKLNDRIEKKQNNENEKEKSLRKLCCEKGKITEEERDSEKELWKILLKKRVDREGKKKAYESIKQGIEEKYEITETQFSNWLQDDEMILPRSKRHQKILIDYIGLAQIGDQIDKVYLGIMRNKKASKRKGTRDYNSMLDKFLISTLLINEVDEDWYNKEFKASEIHDLLDLEKDELNELIKELQKDIHLKKVKAGTLA